jgi:hypothetical protein
MNKAPLLLLLAVLSPTAWAATRVSLDEAEALLSALQKQPDAKAARELAGLELTERATTARLQRWQAAFPGKHAREALLALADASAFLDLPAADVPALATPEMAEQQQILSRTIEYVKTTIHKLPNFYARRSTTHFEDLAPRQPSRFGNLISQGFYNSSRSGGEQEAEHRELHTAGTSSAVVTYRNGQEVEARARYEEKPGAKGIGLTTLGEFGPILTTVVGDAIRGKITWGHWEQGAAGPLAVLRYAVPQSVSHYSVLVGMAGVDEKPRFEAYHGEIAVEPASGAIERLTLAAESDDVDKNAVANVLVEYGPVTIGGGTYNCPLRGVAFSKVPPTFVEGLTGPVSTPPMTFVNDVSFTQYHVFHAEARILPDYDARQ